MTATPARHGRRNNSRVALVQLALAGYRTQFVAGLRSALGDRLRIGAGQAHLTATVRTGIPASAIDVPLDNVFIAGRRFVYQPRYRRALSGADVWVLELNPRVINTWTALVEGRCRRKRTYVWGHYLGRQLGDTAPRRGRSWQVRLASGVVAYTVEEAASFRRTFPRAHVVTAPNALDNARDIPPVEACAPATDFVYVGRLVAEKQPMLLVDGFAEARRSGRLPPEARLIFIGDGPEQSALHDRCRSLPPSTLVEIRHGTFDGSELDVAYRSAVAAVCGGYVGLNVVQSLTRGVPVVYPLHANHAPEVSLAVALDAAFTFDPATPDAVADALSAAWSDRRALTDRAELQQRALSRHSVEQMVEGFLGVLGS